MNTAPILSYFAPGKRLTTHDIRRALGDLVNGWTVDSVRSAFPGHAVGAGSVVAIDIDGIDLDLPAPSLPAGDDVECIAIVPQTQLLPAAWLGLLRNPRISIVNVPDHHPGVHPYAAAALRLRIRGRRARMLDALNRRSNDLFAGLEDVVGAILNDPFGIRSPRHLAVALGTTVSTLEARCAAFPLGRLEHLITLVRWLVVEHLVSDCGLTVMRAMQMIGIRDKSNFRRQWRRAAYLVGGAGGGGA